jgi:hypothetical protein
MMCENVAKAGVRFVTVMLTNSQGPPFPRSTMRFLSVAESGPASSWVDLMAYSATVVGQLRVMPAMATGVTAKLRDVSDIVKVLEDWETAD